MIRRILFLTLIIAAITSAFAQGQIIGEIQVRGLKNIPETTVLSTMRTKVGQIYQQSQLNRDRQSLEALGFFQDVRIYGQLLEDEKWRVVVEVVEWPIVENINVTGNTVYTNDEIKAALNKAGIETGKVFNVALLDKAAQAISELYRSKGYFARVDKFEPDVENPAILNVHIVEATVNQIIITGNSRTKRSVFDKLMDTEAGDLLNQRTWTDDLRRIYDTRWFETIKPDSREPEVGKVDLIIDVEEARTGIFNIGVQLDPRNRLAGLLSLTETNFQGTGKTIGINLLQSAQGLGTSITLDYADPFIDERRTALNVSVYSRQSLVFGRALFGGGGGGVTTDARFSQRRTGAQVALSRVLNSNTRGTAGLKAERISTHNFLPDPGEEFITQDGDIVSLPLGVIRNRRDNGIDPSRGDWLRIGVEPSFSDIHSVGGLTSGFPILGANFYTKLVLDFRSYYSPQPPRTPETLDAPRRVFAARLFAGSAIGEIPFSEQFFVGGSNGVRGYAEDRFWGRQAILAQLEYRHPIQRSFNVIAFIDYGGAWNGYPTLREFTQSRDINLHLGYGVGINFKTAFGPIRLDIGFDERGQPRTHFLIGSSF